ncbi:VOC family protein [Roseomonas frigidaquae]|uniref:VOC family protein n=1 Tax=Falsiroseomonas frigidaquae TaxID=487318 RepID=A0ABX1ERV6_9PROT|nr:VOC family protein [Falsiroseomonas frigidaquae]NKE43273.1 VOC family protein [Falsiroseomonas frigidaquae]
MTKVIQFLWFGRDMQAAVRCYTSLIPGSAMGPVQTPMGGVEVMEFNLGDQRYRAMQTGAPETFNQSFSISAECETQAEIDHLWDTLKEGGAEVRCGWLCDRWGLSWQIVPREMGTLMSGPNGAQVAQAMMGMVKLDLAALRHAAA